MTNKTLLINLFQSYVSDAEEDVESDGFLSGQDITNKAASELLNDVILYGIHTGRINDDTDETVTHTPINQE